MNYRAHEEMRTEPTYLREQRFCAVAASRIRKSDADPERRRVGLREAMGDAAYEEYRAIDPDSVSDEDLFE